jgi:hypothetical protein
MDPSLPGRLLLMPHTGLLEYDPSTGHCTSLWPGVRAQHRALSSYCFGHAVDAVGHFFLRHQRTLYRLDRRTGLCTVVAGVAGPRERMDAADPLSASFCDFDAVAVTPDGLRLFVIDECAIRLIDLRAGSSTASVTTLCAGIDFRVDSMRWLSSERLLMGMIAAECTLTIW